MSEPSEDYHRERLHCADGVDLIVKTREPTDVDLNQRFRDAGSINTEELTHIAFEIVPPEPNADDRVELSAPPEEIVDGLTVGVTETGQQYTVSTDRLADDGVLVVEKPNEDNLVVAPHALADRIFVQGVLYVPEYTSAWEVQDALDRLAGGGVTDDE